MGKSNSSRRRFYRNSRWYLSAKSAYHYVMTIHGTPREVALGFALGLFIAMTPTLGLQMVIVVFLATLFRWNRFSAMAGVWLTNPVTAPFIYGPCYLIGARILGYKNNGFPHHFHILQIGEILSKTPEILWAMTIGGLIIGIPLAIAGYYISLSAIEKYRRDIKERIARKKAIRTARKRQKKSAARKPPVKTDENPHQDK